MTLAQKNQIIRDALASGKSPNRILAIILTDFFTGWDRPDDRLRFYKTFAARMRGHGAVCGVAANSFALPSLTTAPVTSTKRTKRTTTP